MAAGMAHIRAGAAKGKRLAREVVCVLALKAVSCL